MRLRRNQTKPLLGIETNQLGLIQDGEVGRNQTKPLLGIETKTLRYMHKFTLSAAIKLNPY